jgi:CheY-like chemotaxis protein
MEKVKVLVVEDETIIAESIIRMIEKMGYECVGTAIRAAQRTTAIGRAAIEAAIAVLDLAYASPPRQRRALIDELKRMQIAYLATYLDR